jgi:hypothetical protein
MIIGMRSMSDRRIHARTPDGWSIVRYDRAGKWYAEHDEKKRRSLTLDEAVQEASKLGTYLYLGVPGGNAFDAKMKKVRAPS